MSDTARKHLPPNLEPIGLTREEAAASITVSPSTFDKMVEAGLMPQPREIYGTRKAWSTLEIRRAFHALPCKGSDERNEWDEP